MSDINRYELPSMSHHIVPNSKGRLVYFDDHASMVRELLRDVSMWRGRAMELVGDFPNYQSILDKWDWQERNRKMVRKEKL